MARCLVVTWSRLLVCLVPAAMTIGCGAQTRVPRTQRGDAISARPIRPQAYEAFARASLADESGDGTEALAWYLRAAELDDEEPETWTRIARLRCERDPAGAEQAVRKSLAIDAEYEPAWRARGHCALVHHDARAAEAALTKAATLDPLDVDAALDLATALTALGRSSEAERWLLSLATLFPTRSEVWAAMRGPTEALQRYAVLRVSRHDGAEIHRAERAVLEWAGRGELPWARAFAGAWVDTLGRDVSCRASVMGRWAVDDALMGGHIELARVRAARCRITIDELVARAALLERADLVTDLAIHASPWVRDWVGLRAAQVPAWPNEPISAAGYLWLVRLWAAESGVRLGIENALRLDHEPVLAEDILVTETAARLATEGLLSAQTLPDSAQLIVAVRSGGPARPWRFPDWDVRSRALYAAAFRGSQSERIDVPQGTRDPVLASARAHLGATDKALRARALFEIDPGEPLLVLPVLRLAVQEGDRDTESKARASMAALARTSFERAAVRP